MPELSVVVPVYNSAEILPELYRRLVKVLEGEGVDFELVFVEDKSPDDLRGVLRDLRGKDERVKFLAFSRNFGHQAAVTAGLDAATGRAAVVMDDDLQDPPEVIPAFLEKWRQGFHVVYGIRRARKEPAWKRAAYHTFYRILSSLATLPIPPDTGDFCLYDRKVVQVLRAMPERTRFLRGMRVWAGFRHTGVEYERPSRAAGESTYSLRMLLDLAASGITGFSTFPLRIAFILGAAAALGSFLLALGLVSLKIFYGVDVPGWTSLAVIVLFFSGLILLSQGVTNEYLARIFEEVKARPHYVIEESAGVPLDHPARRAGSED